MGDVPCRFVDKRRRVVVTGAAGKIGQAVCITLEDRWDLVAVDVRPAAGPEDRSVWVSPRDAADLVRAAVEACNVDESPK